MHGIDDSKNTAWAKQNLSGNWNIKEEIPSQDHKGSKLQQSYEKSLEFVEWHIKQI